ncbi:hypothetical protein VTK73DRAFT_4939 [Phialemonium thermophilum]|uniref:Uncharacterized protein n=1 Tax=Phialemonium thermophilum TaxID=223376 RepID=A0ABR3V4M9_9PEZI
MTTTLLEAQRQREGTTQGKLAFPSVVSHPAWLARQKGNHDPPQLLPPPPPLLPSPPTTPN